MNGNSDGLHIRQWLESPDGRRVLAQIAASIRKRRDFKSIQLGFSSSATVFIRKDTSDSDPASSDSFRAADRGISKKQTSPVIDELISEICLFVLEKAERIAPILDSDVSHADRYIYIGFMNHLKEKARQSNVNVQRSLYRRVSEIFSQSDRFYKVRRKNGSAFSLRPAPDNKLIPNLLEEDLCEIPFPLEEIPRIDLKIVNQKANLLALGAYFWERVSAMWGNQAVWIEIIDFIRWLRLHVVMVRSELVESTDHLPLAVEETGQFDEHLVMSWAKLMANHLNEKEKVILYLSADQGMTLAEIARELSFKGSSGPAYHWENALEKLKDFLRDRPWVSPDDLDKEALDLFIGTLMKILKKSRLMPSSKIKHQNQKKDNG